MKVELLDYTPEPEKLIAAAGKLCYSPSGIGDIMEGLTDEKTASFVDMLAEQGHDSVIEHVTFTFGIEGVSRALLAQITRHRIASFSVQSQRYVSEKNFDYVTPPEISAIPQAQKEFAQAMLSAQQSYDKLRDILADAHTEKLKQQGMDEKTARSRALKLANEDARFVLPNACTTKMILTMNARSLKHFFSLRCCGRAQWEIRALAYEMYKLVAPVAPHIFAGAGPSCVSGPCPEGRMSCGRAEEMRRLYRSQVTEKKD